MLQGYVLGRLGRWGAAGVQARGHGKESCPVHKQGRDGVPPGPQVCHHIMLQAVHIRGSKCLRPARVLLAVLPQGGGCYRGTE